MSIETTIVGSNLDAGGNIKIALTNTDAYVGGVRMFSENDDGTATGTAVLVSPETSQDYRLRIGQDSLLFTDIFNGPAQNTNQWSYTNATLTAAQLSAGTVNFGNVQGTTSAHGAFMRTFQYFPIIGTAPLSCEFLVAVQTAQLVANEIWLMGFGLPVAANTAPTDGVWFKLTSLGWSGVISFNGVTVETGILWSAASITLNQFNKWVIIVGEQRVEFWRDDVLLSYLAVPAGQGQPALQASLPAFMMKYNTGNVTNTNIIRVSSTTILLTDISVYRTWAQQMASAGQMGYVGQNGHAQGQTANWTNNTAPTATAIANNATGAFAGLGGISAVLPTLTAGTDGVIFSYVNSSSSVTVTGRNLMITGVKVQGTVTVALTGGPVAYVYGVAFGHTAISLATANQTSFTSGTTHAPRVMFVGAEGYPVTAPVGTLGGGATLELSVPIAVRPGEFVQLIARNVGTVTSLGAITIGATFDSYWE